MRVSLYVFPHIETFMLQLPLTFRAGMVDGGSEAPKPLLVYLDGRLYDVAPFAKKHPGGEKVLRRLAGDDIGTFMRGQERIMSVKHDHSAAAYNILEQYAVEKTHKKDVLLMDETTPILWKVGDLKHDYWTWIHQPYDGTIRLFKSDVLEGMTRTSWYTVPFVWMPLVLYFAFMGLDEMYRKQGFLNGFTASALLFSFGFLMWTLLEYILHRWVFHFKPDPDSYYQITLHFLLHGLHHKTPMDGDRLVFPPTPALFIVGFFYFIYSSLLPFSVFCCFASGKLFGYICYDMVHYYLHHGSPEPSSTMHFRKVYHHNHHFKDFDLAYGISTVLWDHVFQTVGLGPL
ncbi:hypothetical protein L596_029599 [Steinernema carpocapsae]|uniref:Fatty acid 2-hydroxylase n=1 Tax=Steinernema carpocapsae TaxID=34508 RepID=A0A4U5LV48_STECR|nr:hypothetical protein L596_029599 [Steinernema carpocapsae]